MDVSGDQVSLMAQTSAVMLIVVAVEMRGAFTPDDDDVPRSWRGVVNVGVLAVCVLALGVCAAAGVTWIDDGLTGFAGFSFAMAYSLGVGSLVIALVVSLLMPLIYRVLGRE